MNSPELPIPDFDSRSLPDPVPEYVAWIDTMGTRPVMARSLAISANFLFKLHAAASSAGSGVPNVRVYPVMDGVFASSPSRDAMHRFSALLFSTLARLFIQTQDNGHRFLVRGAIAYGPIIHGSSVPGTACSAINTNKAYFDSILLGTPVVQSFAAENEAPPFGLFVHESARAFSPAGEKPFVQRWLPWYRHSDAGNLVAALGDAMTNYFSWCQDRTGWIEYQPERLKQHRDMAEQFLRYI